MGREVPLQFPLDSLQRATLPLATSARQNRQKPSKTTLNSNPPPFFLKGIRLLAISEIITS